MSQPPVLAASVRRWPGMTSEYAWIGAHADENYEATATRPNQIGIAFTGHQQVVYESAGRRHRTDIPPGSTIVSGTETVTWLRVHEPTEALEIYPDQELHQEQIEQRIGEPDGTVLGIASVLRRAHVSDTPLSDVAASTLAHQLAAHLNRRYGNTQEKENDGLLDHRTVDRVTQFIDAGLHEQMTLDDLAAVARLSPFHFARTFARTTGMPPHRFVTSRRMDRARLLIGTRDMSIAAVAGEVGFGNLSHFRRVFRSFHGVAPGNSKIRPPHPRLQPEQ